MNALVFRLLYEIALYSETVKNFAIFTGKHMCWSQFVTNLQTFRPTTLLKRDSSTGAFLWILHIFSENLFWKAPVNKLFITRKNNKWDHSAVRIFKSKKYQANICPQNFLENYTFVACFYDFRYARVISNLTQASEKIIPLVIFLFAIGIVTVFRHIVF